MSDELGELRQQLWEKISSRAADHGMRGFSAPMGPASRLKSSESGIIWAFHERVDHLRVGLLFRDTDDSGPNDKLNQFGDALRTITFREQPLNLEMSSIGYATGRATAARSYFVVDNWHRDDPDTEMESITEAVSAMRILWDELPELQPN